MGSLATSNALTLAVEVMKEATGKTPSLPPPIRDVAYHDYINWMAEADALSEHTTDASDIVHRLLVTSNLE